MKLGILIVYLFNEVNSRLLDIHTEYIQRFTSSPYTIYGSVNRLDPKLIPRITENPRIKPILCNPTNQRGMQEHSFYLEQLVDIAISDGCSHLVTLHLDSFPVLSGWDQFLANKLTADCVMATLENINSACLFFTTDYYRNYNPNFLVSQEEQQQPTYQRYIREIAPTLHTGVGFGYQAFLAGKTWYSLQKSNRIRDDGHGMIYDDMIFHLHGAVRYEPVIQKTSSKHPESSNGRRFLATIKRIYQEIVPRKIRQQLRLDRFALVKSIDAPLFQSEREDLFRDPDGYIQKLRVGVSKGSRSQNRSAGY